MGNCTTFKMFENPRKGRQPRNFIQNVPKILVLKSSSEQIFSENWLGCPWFIIQKWQAKHKYGCENLELVLKVKHVEEKKHSFPFGTSAGTIFKSPVSPGNAPLVWPEEPCSKYFRTGIFGNLLNTNTIQYFIQEIKKNQSHKISLERECPSFPSPHYLPLGLRGWHAWETSRG